MDNSSRRRRAALPMCDDINDDDYEAHNKHGSKRRGSNDDDAAAMNQIDSWHAPRPRNVNDVSSSSRRSSLSSMRKPTSRRRHRSSSTQSSPAHMDVSGSHSAHRSNNNNSSHNNASATRAMTMYDDEIMDSEDEGQQQQQQQQQQPQRQRHNQRMNTTIEGIQSTAFGSMHLDHLVDSSYRTVRRSNASSSPSSPANNYSYNYENNNDSARSKSRSKSHRRLSNNSSNHNRGKNKTGRRYSSVRGSRTSAAGMAASPSPYLPSPSLRSRRKKVSASCHERSHMMSGPLPPSRLPFSPPLSQHRRKGRVSAPIPSLDPNATAADADTAADSSAVPKQASLSLAEIKHYVLSSLPADVKEKVPSHVWEEIFNKERVAKAVVTASEGVASGDEAIPPSMASSSMQSQRRNQSDDEGRGQARSHASIPINQELCIPNRRRNSNGNHNSNNSSRRRQRRAESASLLEGDDDIIDDDDDYVPNNANRVNNMDDINDDIDDDIENDDDDADSISSELSDITGLTDAFPAGSSKAATSKARFYREQYGKTTSTASASASASASATRLADTTAVASAEAPAYSYLPAIHKPPMPSTPSPSQSSVLPPRSAQYKNKRLSMDHTYTSEVTSTTADISTLDGNYGSSIPSSFRSLKSNGNSAANPSTMLIPVPEEGRGRYSTERGQRRLDEILSKPQSFSSHHRTTLAGEIISNCSVKSQASSCTSTSTQVATPCSKDQQLKDEQQQQQQVQPEQERKPTFSTVSIRYYERILCDNPAVHDGGCALGIGWNFRSGGTISLDKWERHTQRYQRRSQDDLLLTKHQREALLRDEWGFSQQEVAEMTRRIQKAKSQRKQTIGSVQISGIEEVFESAGRKMKRMLSFRNVKV